MKKIIFYSCNGATNITLAALAFAKPKKVQIDWYVQLPVGESRHSLDTITSLHQLGFKLEALQGTWKEKILLPLRRKVQINLNYPCATETPNIKNLKIFPIVGQWWKMALKQNPDTILLSTVRFLGPGDSLATLSALAKEVPLFLHEYGTTMKKISGFDFYKERHNFLRAIFTHGKLYHNQSKITKTESVLTGSSKSDFYHQSFLFPPPTKKPFLVYCNTCSHLDIYDDRLSEPKKWIGILKNSCRLLGLELVIKLHHSTIFLFQNESWKNLIYFNAYTADLFRQASGIISDPSSVLAEALLANKPLFVPQLGLPSWNYMDLMLSACHILEKDPLKNARIIKAALKNDPLSPQREKLIKLWWYKPDGNASKRIWQELLDRI